MQHSSAWDWHRIPRHARRTGAIVLAILVALVLFLWLFDWSPLTGPIATVASHALHRKIQIGRFSAHLLGGSPTISFQDLRIENASWVKSGEDLAQVRRASAAIDLARLLGGRVVLSLLEIDDPRLDLERDAQGRTSWEFNASAENLPPKPAGKPPRLPAVTQFTVRGGTLKIVDALHQLRFEGSVVANERAAHPELEPLHLQGHGELNGEPFDLTFQGSALFNLRVDRPYSFVTEVRAGPMDAAAQGEIDKPFDLGHFGMDLKIRGDNLAGLYYLTGLALPFTPPFQFSGHLRNDGGNFRVQDVQARVGQSDLQGALAVDSTGVRPALSGNLVSHSFNLSDLAPTLGAGVPNDSGTASLEAPGSKPSPQGLLPDYQFQFDRLHSMDAQVQLHADAVKTSSVPIRALTVNLQLKEGVLSVDPLEFTLPEGRLTGAVRIDTRQGKGLTALDMRLENVDLSQFKPAKSATAPLDGTLLSRAQLKGTGNSVHEILATSSGTITAIIPHGEIRQAFAELTSVDVARGLGLLLTGSQKQSTINCGIAAFRVQRGVARAEPIDLSTSTVNITGSGEFDFGTEQLHLELRGQPKKVAPFRVHAPILIGGSFAHPSIGIAPGTLLAQAGVAAALGVLATPAAAVLAFVDPGLAKNHDCAVLLSGPQARSTEHPGPPEANPPKPAQQAPAPHP